MFTEYLTVPQWVSTVNRIDSAPALLTLSEKDQQVPKQDNQIFLTAMKTCKKDMAIPYCVHCWFLST